mgnify:FL=1|jgi:WD40 repeat protein
MFMDHVQLNTFCISHFFSISSFSILHSPSFFSEKDEQGGARHLLAFQPSDLSDAVTDVKWSPHDSNIFGSVTSDGRILLWDVKRIDPSVSHDIGSDFTASESEAIQEAEDDLTKRKERKINKEKEANDPLLMLAMSMKQQKGEATEEDLKPVDTEEELAAAEDVVQQMKTQYKKLTCIEFAPDAPVVVVGAADGTVCCLRIHGMAGGESFSTDEQRDRLEASLFVDEA